LSILRGAGLLSAERPSQSSSISIPQLG
jgi:hypothetical protein